MELKKIFWSFLFLISKIIYCLFYSFYLDSIYHIIISYTCICLFFYNIFWKMWYYTTVIWIIRLCNKYRFRNPTPENYPHPKVVVVNNWTVSNYSRWFLHAFKTENHHPRCCAAWEQNSCLILCSPLIIYLYRGNNLEKIAIRLYRKNLTLPSVSPLLPPYSYIYNTFSFFRLKDNCFTVFCGLLSYINKNQSWVNPCPLPPTSLPTTPF